MSIKFYQQWYDLFNNFSANAIEYEGEVYPTSEHAYQAAKCESQEAKDDIRHAKSPIVAKEIANGKFKGDRIPDWDVKKLEIMERILRAKLSQHEEVKSALMRSSNDIIEEDSKEDNFWGVGKDGHGLNHLGKLWMKIRDEL